MRRFKKSDRTEWESRIPSLKGVKFRKEGVDINGNRISSTDNEKFGKYAGWRKHNDNRYYGQDLYYDTMGDYCKDFTIEGKISRIVKECISQMNESVGGEDLEYAKQQIYIWMNNDRPLYDKKMAIVKMLAKKPSLDVDVLANSSVLAQYYRDIINTARKSGDIIKGDRKQLLLFLAQTIITAVGDFKYYLGESKKRKKLVKESHNKNKTPRFVYMGEVGDGEWELFDYAKEEGWIDENTSAEDFDVLECFNDHCSSAYCDGTNEPSADFIDLGDVVFVYVWTYSNANKVRDLIEDFIRFERTADVIGRRDNSWHEADAEEVENNEGILYEFPSGLCRYYAR